MASTSCFSQRKLSAETAVPMAHPAPHAHPRQATSAIAPPAPMAHISFQMRTTARSMRTSSRAAGSPSTVIARIPHELPDELDKPGHNSQDQPRDIHPGGFEFLIQQVTEHITEQRRHGEQERKRRVFAYQHRPRFFRHTYSLLRGALGRLFDQITHLGVGGLHGGMNAELLERFGGGRADGTDLAPAQLMERGVLESEFAGDAREVHHLDGGGEEHHVEGSRREAAYRFA